MSGTSGSDFCPKCGKSNLMTYSNWKPYDIVSGECLDCGFYYDTKEGQMTLEEVNERRKDYDLKPLKELAEQTE